MEAVENSTVFFLDAFLLTSTEMRFPDRDLEPLHMQWSLSEIVEVVYQLLFFVVGTPLNIVAFKRTTKKIREGGLESRLMKFSRHLLIAHLLVLVIYGVWRSYWFYTIVWTQGNTLCKLYSFLQAFSFHLWSNLVASIAVDMLCCITSPLRSYRNGTHRVNILIAISWIAAFICSTPMVIFRGTVKRETDTQEFAEQCYPLLDRFSREAFFTFYAIHVLTTFWLPLLIIVVCYAIIGCSLRKQMSERLALLDQVLSLLRIICDEGTLCDSITGKLNWLQVLIIASTCINPFLYRFGTESQGSRRRPKSSVTGGNGGAFGWLRPTATPGAADWTSTMSRNCFSPSNVTAHNAPIEIVSSLETGAEIKDNLRSPPNHLLVPLGRAIDRWSIG